MADATEQTAKKTKRDVTDPGDGELRKPSHDSVAQPDEGETQDTRAPTTQQPCIEASQQQQPAAAGQSVPVKAEPDEQAVGAGSAPAAQVEHATGSRAETDRQVCICYSVIFTAWHSDVSTQQDGHCTVTTCIHACAHVQRGSSAVRKLLFMPAHI